MLWHGKNFRGIINKAKEMIFNNTGTDLISTNAEDAIKEVNSKITKYEVEVDKTFDAGQTTYVRLGQGLSGYTLVGASYKPTQDGSTNFLIFNPFLDTDNVWYIRATNAQTSANARMKGTITCMAIKN